MNICVPYRSVFSTISRYRSLTRLRYFAPRLWLYLCVRMHAFILNTLPVQQDKYSSEWFVDVMQSNNELSPWEVSVLVVQLH